LPPKHKAFAPRAALFNVKVGEFVKVILFEVTVPHASVTVNTYVPEDKLVGALAGEATYATPLRVQEYVNGAVPPFKVIVAEPVAVLPHGISFTAIATEEIGEFTVTVTGSTSVQPATDVALI
jgi:hypothetical protein